MADRFYSPTTCEDGHATLAGPEAHHLLHVKRASVGDIVTLFDGNGGEYQATIQECRRSEVLLTTSARREVSRELTTRLVLGVALPKGERQKWLVEKLTELGVAELVPLSTARSVADVHGKSLERLERAVIEASKQCGRNTLMQVASSHTLDGFLASATGVKLMAHPNGTPLSGAFAWPLREASIAIGPEGGFTDAELDLATQHGWTSVHLGPSILRIETAAVAIAAIVATHAE
jgi:16S rRNA (uracil1498-N3)-methyltransferase